MQKKLWPIFIVVFLNMLGFGIIIPVIRDLTEILVNNSGYNPNYYAFYAGILMASYSFFQLIFSPMLGRASDLYGRRIILVISVVGSVISYLMWAVSHSYVFFLISRIISGVTGANLSVAQSYIADVTNEKDRAKYMGLMGAIFGIGFILGPFFGGVASTIDINHIFGGVTIFNRFGAIGILTAVLSIINLIWIIFGLPESRTRSEMAGERGSTTGRREEKGGHRVFKFMNVRMIKNKHIVRLFLIYFIMQLGFNHIEAILSWDLKDRFNMDTRETGYFFAFMGIILALVQGGVYRILLKKYSLLKLSLIGTTSLLLGFFLMPISYPLLMASLTIVVLAFGMGISSPSIMTLTSIYASKEEQGVTMGMLQSFGSLSRVIAPITATLAYDVFAHSAPYIISGVLAFIGLILIQKERKESGDTK
ncbi:MAG: MFS transporter [Spirochaetia bacterium]|nr:MFS transporter [Spirochaetia bacterium]